MPDDFTRPTVADLRMSLVNERVTIWEHVDHPTSGELVGYIRRNLKGEWAYTTPDHHGDPMDEWGTADSMQQAGEELLHEHLLHWQDAYDREMEWQAYNQRPTYGRGHAA